MHTTSETIREAYLQASSFLASRGVAEPERQAEWLLCHMLGWDRTRLFMRWEEVFPDQGREAWSVMLERKALGEPVQYIIGEQEFYGLPFTVNPAVLIPRPETELLVEEMVRLGKQLFPPGTPPPVAADIGSGSGAIAVTIAAQCPDWRVYSSDISETALEVARTNAQRNGVGDRVTFLQGSLLEPYLERGLAIDILVSNPPYIRTADMSSLQTEVGRYEPHTALDGGVDGLHFYREMIGRLGDFPRFPLCVGFEVGQGQAEEVRDLIKETGAYGDIRIVPDLAGIDRHVVALRKK